MEILVRPDTVSFVSHIAVTLLFAGLFAFQYRETRQVYFQYWTMAWVLLCASLLLRLGWMTTGRTLFLLPSGLLQLAFAASLLFAGAAVTGGGEIQVTSPALLIPALGGALYAVGILTDFPGSHTLRGLLLLGLFGWNFAISRRLWKSGPGSGRKIYSVSLLWGAALALHDVLGHPRYHDTYYVILETFLALSAMMMWMEAQNDHLRRANEELDQSRRQLAQTAQTDPLTGLLNRTTLHEICEGAGPVSGVVAVLDLDNFKDINDAWGHLVGDEVLASVGNLIRSSIRKTDRAWRWGGDEFVILFQDRNQAAARDRLEALEQHLQRFRIRGRGVLPVGVSWGTAQVASGSLRQAIEAADHGMYLKKKEKLSPSADRVSGGS